MQTSLIKELSNTQHVTFSIWFYIDEEGDGSYAAMPFDNYSWNPEQRRVSAYIGYGQHIELRLDDPTYTPTAKSISTTAFSGAAWEPDMWNYLIIMFNGEGINNNERLKIYVNAEQIQPLSFPLGLIPDVFPDFRSAITGRMRINQGGAGISLMNVDEFQIFGESLTAQQIQRLYAESAPKFRMTLK